MSRSTQLQEDIARQSEYLECLEQARGYVTYLLGSGVLGFESCERSPINVIEDLADEVRGYYNFQDILKRSHAAQSLPPDAAMDEMEGLLISAFGSGAYAGYLLGIALGQALGPDAFKGGAR